MSTFRTLRGATGQGLYVLTTGRAVATAGRTRTLGLAIVAALAFALVGGAASASAAGQNNYACPGQSSLEHTVSEEHGSNNTACGAFSMYFLTEGKEGKVSSKGLKICVQNKEGGAIKLPKSGVCKTGWTLKEVAEL